jgi:histidinol dehydrogenase
MIRILESKDMGRVLSRRTARLTEAEEIVRPILETVRKRGDKGLMELARKFDRLDRKSVRVPRPTSVPPSKSPCAMCAASPRNNSLASTTDRSAAVCA